MSSTSVESLEVTLATGLDLQTSHSVSQAFNATSTTPNTEAGSWAKINHTSSQFTEHIHVGRCSSRTPHRLRWLLPSAGSGKTFAVRSSCLDPSREAVKEGGHDFTPGVMIRPAVAA